MKGLTLWRPWPYTIFHLEPPAAKRIENRDWAPPKWILGQRIALHAGKYFDSDAAEDLCTMLHLHPDGTPPAAWADEGIIGTAVVDGFYTSDRSLPSGQKRWWRGRFAWSLTGVRRLLVPIQCKGAQKLWTLSAALEQQVLNAGYFS